MDKNWERYTKVFGHRQAIDDELVYPSVSLCSSYRVYKGRNLGKRHGTKCGAIGNSLGNPMGTSSIHRELHWEPGENKMWAPKSRNFLIKKSNPTPPCLPPSLPTPKEKELGPPECMLSLLIGCLNFLIRKLFVIIFFLG